MASPSLPSEPFSPKSLYTITGAAAAVWLFCAMLYTVLGALAGEVIYRFIAFVLCVLIAIGMLIEKKKYGLKYWLLVIPNSALIFVNASGFNAVNTGGLSTPGMLEREKKTASSMYNDTSPGKGSMGKAGLLPFIRDIAWWPDQELKQQVVNLQEKNDSLKVKNNQLEQLVATFSMSPDKENYASQIAQLKERIDILTIENDALKSRSPNNATNESLIGQLNDKDNQLKNCKVNLQNVQNSLATSNSRLEELNKSMDYYRGLFESCNNSTADLKRRMEVLVSELNSTRSQLNKCNEELAKSSREGDGREIKALYEQLRSSQRALSVCNGNLTNAKDSLKIYNANLQRLKAALEACQKSKISIVDPNKHIPIQLPSKID